MLRIPLKLVLRVDARHVCLVDSEDFARQRRQRRQPFRILSKNFLSPTKAKTVL